MSDGKGMITDRENIYIQFYWTGEDEDAFICGIDGHMNISTLEDIDEQVNNERDLYLQNGCGDYLFSASWEDPQTGEYGRVEIAGYWDLTLIKHRPVKED